MAHYEKLVKQFGGIAVTLLIFIFGAGLAQAAAAPPLSIKSAAYNKKTSSLVIKTRNKGPGGLLTLLHSKGGVLGQTKKAEETFTIPLKELGEIPCQVEARLGELKISKAVAGAGAECSKVPVCKILKPVSNLKTTINQPTHFEAQYALKDKKAGPLAIEWDFAGGVMGHPYQKPLKGNKPILSGKHKTDATFVRDNSRYHVRFMATDTQGRHCESGIYVDVGTPPTDLPDATALEDMVEASQTNAPAKGSALKIPAGEKVVLPYQDWTMQTATDARTVPNVYVVYGPQVNNINATVYEKARKPPVIGGDKVELKYSAASNPADPVGPNSINSTSQNWPVGTRLMEASVQKSDYFETYTRPADVILADGYYSYSFTGFLSPELVTEEDEGYHNPELFPPINLDHGRYMPGKANPYVDNIPQAFSKYVEKDNLFAAQMLPLTDIDDVGRINPTPLFRVEAKEKEGNAAIAVTDIVVNSGRDLHCRECHAKGKMGASPEYGGHMNHGNFPFIEADSDSLFDQEYAAIENIVMIHGDFKQRYTELSLDDGPVGCADERTCHVTAITTTAFGKSLAMSIEYGGGGGKLSSSMHRFHGTLQYKDENHKNEIVRDSMGGRVRVNPYKAWDRQSGSIKKSLFPVKDSDGNILPMEENCLKCHGGMREQCYRDRMYTAGITCYQCHGDMLAVGNVFKKSIPSADLNVIREPWLDQPDCGSCHTGNANQGNKSNSAFFSGGVRNIAFDPADPSASPWQPDRFNPDEIRFAVPLVSTNLGDVFKRDGEVKTVAIKTPLFRAAKDNHGQVACGACHGAAHAIWPNRDPNANDNVTALQLQGHSGPIAECSVCHTDDAFAQRDDLDEGLRTSNAMDHVLGGPHNMHPINDPNWWRQADGDLVDSTPDSPKREDGVIKGGWHNDYAKFPGRAGEDQCAACHGNDHLGTRLSKTPVDREFVNDKGKKIIVKAGTAIGCKLCHTVEKSCTGSPVGLECGKSSQNVSASTNLAPVIDVAPKQAATVVFGNDYSYAVQARDPEGSPLTYQLVHPDPATLSIDAKTGLVTMSWTSIQSYITSLGNPSLPVELFSYQIVVRDSEGSQALQNVKVSLYCQDGVAWDVDTSSCTNIVFTTTSPVNGITGEQEYSYQAIAKQRNGKPLTYSLSNPPEGMVINASDGLIKWMAPANLSDTFNFTVIASNIQGETAQQHVSLMVCAAPLHWDQSYQSCREALNITSYPTIFGMTDGESYQYQVTASQVNNLPVSFSLSNAPQGMTIDSKTGLIDWVVQASGSGAVDFTVNAQDNALNTATPQDVSVMVCVAPEQWDPGYEACKGPIEFTSSSLYGVDAGQLYSYLAAASHANGLTLTYSLADNAEAGVPKPAGITIDANTGLVSWTAQPQPAELGNYAYFNIFATDSNGYSSPQSVALMVCDPGSNWSDTLFSCRGPVRITSQPVNGLDPGQTFRYQVIATDTNSEGLPITYSLSDAPADMVIDPNTGLIEWIAKDPQTVGWVSFTITATDKLGKQDQQVVYQLVICTYPSEWKDENGGGCF